MFFKIAAKQTLNALDSLTSLIIFKNNLNSNGDIINTRNFWTKIILEY